MKKIIFAVFAVFMFTMASVYADDDIKIVINNKPIITEDAPVIIEGRTMVPVRRICEAMGFEVDWNADTQTILIKGESCAINMMINSYMIKRQIKNSTVPSLMIYNDDWIDTQEYNQQIDINIPPMIINDRTYIPLRILANLMFVPIRWDEQTKTIYIDEAYDYMEIPSQNDDSEKLLLVSKNGKYGFIDRYDNLIVDLIYDRADEFYERITRVQKGDKFGYIDCSGKEIIPCIYTKDELGFLAYDRIAVIQNGNLGYFDCEGNIVVPCIYDSMYIDLHDVVHRGEELLQECEFRSDSGGIYAKVALDGVLIWIRQNGSKY